MACPDHYVLFSENGYGRVDTSPVPSPTTQGTKFVVSSDGHTVLLPQQVSDQSQVLAKHDDGFELFTIDVPFTLREIFESLVAFLSDSFTEISQLRLFDFLGCDVIVSSAEIRKISVDDWTQILLQRRCFEQKVMKIKWEGDEAYGLHQFRGYLIKETKNGFIIDINASDELIDAAQKLGHVEIRYSTVGTTEIRYGCPPNSWEPTSIPYTPHHLFRYDMTFFFDSDSWMGASLNLTEISSMVFFRVGDQWKFKRCREQSHIEIVDEPKSLKPVRYGKHKAKELKPYLEYLSERDRHAHGIEEDIDFPLLKKGLAIPQTLQWLTADVTVYYPYYMYGERNDFYGTVVDGSIDRAIDTFPNARCYRLQQKNCIASEKTLNKLGSAIITHYEGEWYDIRRW